MIYLQTGVKEDNDDEKMFIYASVVELATGIVYWLYKKEKSNYIVSKSFDNKLNFEPKLQEEVFLGQMLWMKCIKLRVRAYRLFTNDTQRLVQ